MLSYLPLMVSCHANSFGLVGYLTLKCMFEQFELRKQQHSLLEKVWLLLWIIQTNKAVQKYSSLYPDEIIPICYSGYLVWNLLPSYSFLTFVSVEVKQDGPLSLDLIFWENNPGFYHNKLCFWASFEQYLSSNSSRSLPQSY